MGDWFGAGKKNKETEKRLREEAATVDSKGREEDLLKKTVEASEGLVGNAARSLKQRKKMLEEL